jgi:hypothetical protein
MSKTKSLLILVVILLLCCAAYITITRSDKSDTDVASGDESIQVLKASTAQITELSWDYGGEANALSLGEDGVWTAPADKTSANSLPIDQTYPAAMLTALAEITATRVIENAEASEYGLTEPICTIQIPDGIITSGAVSETASVAVQIGDESGLGSRRYIAVGDGNVYIVPAALYDAFAYNIADIAEATE